MFNQVVIQMGFWTAWLVIPAIFELSPAIVAFFRNHFSKISSKQEYHPGRMPQLTVIVPIYNSGDTLYDCLKSIAESNYPKHLIRVLFVQIIKVLIIVLKYTNKLKWILEMFVCSGLKRIKGKPKP